MAAGDKNNPYGVDSDPMRGRKNPLQEGPNRAVAGDLKRRQKKSIQDAMNPEDSVGNAVRDLWKKVRGK